MNRSHSHHIQLADSLPSHVTRHLPCHHLQIVPANKDRRLSSVDTANSDHIGPSYFGAGYGSYRAESDRSKTAAENAALHAEEALMNRERWQEEERKFLQQASAVAAGETVAASGHLRSAMVEQQQPQ